MRKNTFLAIIIFFMFLLIIQSDMALNGARYGFMLWYNTLLPTLLPFMILSNIIIKTNTARVIGRFLRPVTNFLHIKDSCGYPIIVGLLCGYPMGAYVCARLNENGDINDYETNYLAAICNNVSPMFMVSFICLSSLNERRLIPFVVLNMLAGSVVSALLLKKNPSALNKPVYNICNHTAAPEKITLQNFIQVLDESINNSLTAILKLCAYVIMFSIIGHMIGAVDFLSDTTKGILASLCEITSGIDRISKLNIPIGTKYIIILTTTAFGGLSSIFQTASLAGDSSLSIKKYIQHKLIISLVTMVIAVFVVYVLL